MSCFLGMLVYHLNCLRLVHEVAKVVHLTLHDGYTVPFQVTVAYQQHVCSQGLSKAVAVQGAGCA